MKLELIDELISLGDGTERSLDCIVVVKPKQDLQIEDLQKRILKVQKIHPKTSSFPVEIITNKNLEEFTNIPLKTIFNLELALLEDKSVALKMSHVLGDAVSMLLWLIALFNNNTSAGPLELKEYPSKKDTAYRKIRTSEVWPRPIKKRNSSRKFNRFSIPHNTLIQDYTLNDIITLALLDSLPLARKSIWLPVNIRKNFFEGFGNGLSRQRIYPPPAGPLKERLNHIRKQKMEAKSSGEISLPHPEFSLSSPFKKALFKAWIKRPWADWTSISFSHLVDHDDKFNLFDEVWGIPNIMPSHQASIFAVSHRDRTDLTLAYDPSGVKGDEANFLIKRLCDLTQEAFDDLST